MAFPNLCFPVTRAPQSTESSSSLIVEQAGVGLSAGVLVFVVIQCSIILLIVGWFTVHKFRRCLEEDDLYDADPVKGESRTVLWEAVHGITCILILSSLDCVASDGCCDLAMNEKSACRWSSLFCQSNAPFPMTMPRTACDSPVVRMVCCVRRFYFNDELLDIALNMSSILLTLSMLCVLWCTVNPVAPDKSNISAPIPIVQVSFPTKSMK